MLEMNCLDDPFAGIGPNIIYLIEARIAYERSQFERARDAALEGIRLCHAKETNLLVDFHRQLALIHNAAGEREAAHRTIEEIERIPLPEYERRLETIAPTLRAQFALHQGELETASQWMKRFFEDEAERAKLPERTFFLIKAEQLLHARILIARKRADEALDLLTPLRAEFEAGDVPRLLIETLALMAMAYQEKGEQERAVETITQALRLGAPEGYTRVFAYEGKGMIRLLTGFQKGRAAASLRVPAGYLKSVMEACGLGLSEEAETPLKEISLQGTGDMTPLTSREIEILQLMALGYSNQKIADKLYVSVNTIKTHASNLFDKLNARNRVDALLRAREAKIL
jgi:LuxR family maltose regulon positive regulatory protein